MAYTKQQWQDATIGAPYGPISGARLNYIEQGIADAHALAAAKMDAPTGAPAANDTMKWNGSLWVPGKIVDAMISSAAAIAVAKLAPGAVGATLQTLAGPTVGWSAAAPVGSGITPTAPTAPGVANYTIPGGATVVTTQAQLDTALAGTTAIDIKVMNGSYSRATAVTPAAGHRIWCESITGVVFNYGWNWQYKSNWQMHGGTYNIPDVAHAAQDGGENGVVLNWVGTPANASGMICTDMIITGAGVVRCGIVLRCPHLGQFMRIQGSNFTDHVLRISDNTLTSTAVITTISDIDCANTFRSTRGASNGTGEAAVWVGHQVTNGVRRIKVRNSGWMGIAPLNNCRSTTFSDLDIDSVYGIVPAPETDAGDTKSVAMYFERNTHDIIVEKFSFGPDIVVGVNGEWNGGTPGNAAINNLEMRLGTINCNRQSVYAQPGALNGQLMHRCGIYGDEGSAGIYVHDVVFKNQNWACIGRYLNASLPATANNDYSGRIAGAVTETTAHILSTTP